MHNISAAEAQEDRCRSLSVEQQQTPIRVRRLSSWDELEAHRNNWRDVLEDSEGPTIFSTTEWLGAWWRAFAKDSELIALTFFDPDDRIVGLAPLYLDSVAPPFGLRLRRLRFVGDGTHDSDNLDLIFRRGYEDACVAALIDWLSSELDWDVCELNTLPKTSATLPLLVSGLQKSGWCYLTRETPCSRIMLPASWDAYLSHISKKEKGKIAYRTNRLKRRYSVQISKCTGHVEISESLENLFALHQKRWKMRGEQGTFASSERRSFYYDIGASFLERGWLEFWELRLDDKPVAIQFSFRYHKTVYVLQEGFDPSFSSDSVGYVLRAAVLKNLISEGVDAYDYLGGTDPSKERWGAQAENYINVHFARASSRGSLYLNLRQTIRSSKRWLKTLLSAQALSLLRKMYPALNGGPSARKSPFWHSWSTDAEGANRLNVDLGRRNS